MKHSFANKFIIIIALFFLTACATSGVSVKVSKFDNSKEIVLIPAWVISNKMYLGLTYRSSKPEEIILKVGLSSYNNTGNIQGVFFNINGEIISAIPVENLKQTEKNIDLTNGNCYTYAGVTTCQSGMSQVRKERLFIIPASLPKKILDSNTAYIRISSDGDNIEIDLKNDGGDFIKLLPKFVANIQK